MARAHVTLRTRPCPCPCPFPCPCPCPCPLNEQTNTAQLKTIVTRSAIRGNKRNLLRIMCYYTFHVAYLLFIQCPCARMRTSRARSLDRCAGVARPPPAPLERISISDINTYIYTYIYIYTYNQSNATQTILNKSNTQYAQ